MYIMGWGRNMALCKCLMCLIVKMGHAVVSLVYVH